MTKKTGRWQDNNDEQDNNDDDNTYDVYMPPVFFINNIFNIDFYIGYRFQRYQSIPILEQYFKSILDAVGYRK